MDNDQVAKLKPGLYRVYHTSGIVSLAAIGNLHNGDKWISCCDWSPYRARFVSESDQSMFDLINKVELIEEQKKHCGAIYDSVTGEKWE